jgi:hypothetical protein
MDGLLILAIVSAVSGWGVAFHQMRQSRRYRMAWLTQCSLREDFDARFAVSEKERVRFRDAYAFEASRAIVSGNECAKAKDALKCALETKSAVEAALAELEQFAREAVELSAARWKQIEELQQHLSGVTK